MQTIFVAFASGTDFQKTIIEEAAAAASTAKRQIVPWSTQDPSGHPIQKTVEEWIDAADAVIVDISLPNHNVTYELGYAIGQGKPIRLIRSSHIDYKPIKEIGLIDTVAHDSYDYQIVLKRIFQWGIKANKWSEPLRNKEQPIFVLQPPLPMDWSRKAVSAIKKVARMKFRNFNPNEISRLTASEAYEDTAASSGVVTFWLDEASPTAEKHNQRTAFIYGIARGMGIPCLLLAHHSSQLPLDLHDIADRWDHLDQIDGIISKFRDEVSDELLNYTNPFTSKGEVALRQIAFGDPIAENEQSTLADFFLETDAYFRAREGESHVLIGRKGSGKSAVFLQVRDFSRSNKQNIVIDLMPEGYSLIKLKEFILDQVGYGSRKEIISAFWQYVLWLEIAHKIIEKDASRARRDPSSLPKFTALEDAFLARVDTGIGDFSERLRILSDNIISRFTKAFGEDEIDSLKSSKILEIIYGQDIRILRETIMDYLKIKGFVYFLFDNLDRFWTPGGFDQEDATILVGLAEAMQEIQRKFAKDSREFRWAIFLRSDVYEFLISGMADYGKLATYSLDWSDREQLKAVLTNRLYAAAQDLGKPVSFSDISATHVHGVPVLDFVVDASLMRPRYLIRLAETARRRALTLGRNKMIEDDFDFALKELGWQVLEDLDRETRDLVPDGADLIFELLSQRDNLTSAKLRYAVMKNVSNSESVDNVIDVLIWSGALGVTENDVDKYIYDCGYRKQYLSSIIRKSENVQIVLHPTLCAAA